MKKKPRLPPRFRDETEERQFWEAHDSSDYIDWSRAKRVRMPNLRPSQPTARRSVSIADQDVARRKGGRGLTETPGFRREAKQTRSPSFNCRSLHAFESRPLHLTRRK